MEIYSHSYILISFCTTPSYPCVCKNNSTRICFALLSSCAGVGLPKIVTRKKIVNIFYLPNLTVLKSYDSIFKLKVKHLDSIKVIVVVVEI